MMVFVPQFWTWNRWGRVGVPGQNALRAYSNAAAAIADFEKKFTAKTKNYWADRENFVKYPGKVGGRAPSRSFD